MLIQWLLQFTKSGKAMVAPVSDKFPTRGGLKLWGTQDINWFDDGGEIRFLWGVRHQKSVSRSKSLGDMIEGILRDKNNKGFIPEDIMQLEPRERYEAVERYIVDRLLEIHRPHALPDENQYCAGAAGVTQSGRLFVEVNNEAHIVESFAGRGCAETGMLRKAQKLREKTDVRFAALYLKSGVMEEVNGKRVDKYEPQVSCLCGECRQNLRSHMPGGRFIMLPSTGDSQSLKVNKTAKRHSELAPGEAWQISNEVMYPLPEYLTLPRDKADIIEKGYGYISDITKPSLPLQHEFSDMVADQNGMYTMSAAQFMRLRHVHDHIGILQSLNENPTPVNINRAMLQLIKKAYVEHKEHLGIKKNLEVTAVLIKTDKGEFFTSILVNGKLWLPSKPPEVPTAIANAFNRVGISEMYTMTCNDHQLQEEIDQRKDDAYIGHKVKMPSPASLGRLIKNLKKDQDVTIHVIPINDGTLTDGEIEKLCTPKLTFSAREMFGPDFANPKKTLAMGIG